MPTLFSIQTQSVFAVGSAQTQSENSQSGIDTYVDFIPDNQAEIDSKWTLSVDDGIAGTEVGMAFDGGATGDQFHFWAGGYPSRGKTLPKAVVFDTTKPVYLEYDFTVSGDGGAVFYIGDTAKPWGGVVDISSCIKGVNGEIGAGTYSGKTQLNYSLMKSYKDATCNSINEDNNTLTVDSIYVMATWGAGCVVTEMKITGTEAKYATVDFIPGSQSEINSNWTLSVDDGIDGTEVGMDYTGGTNGNTYRFWAGGYPKRGKKLSQAVVLDTAKPVYLEYDFAVSGGGGAVFYIGDTAKPWGSVVDISSCINGVNGEIGAGTYTGRKQLDYNLMRAFNNASCNSLDDNMNTLTIDRVYVTATWGANCTVRKMRIVGTPVADTETVDFIPISQNEIDTQWVNHVSDGFSGQQVGMSFTGGSNGNLFCISSQGYPSRGKTLTSPVVFDTSKPVYLDYDFTVSGDGGICIGIGDTGKGNGIAEIDGCIDGKNGEKTAGTHSGKKQLDYSLMGQTWNNSPNNSIDFTKQTLTVSSIYLTSTWGSNIVIKKLRLIGTPVGSTEASFVNVDKTTSGSWDGAYGTLGYLLPLTGTRGVVNIPSGVTAGVARGNKTINTGTAVSQSAFLTSPGTASYTEGGHCVTNTNDRVTVAVSSKETLAVTLYTIGRNDSVTGGENQSYQVQDAFTGEILTEIESIGETSTGAYITFNIRGSVNILISGCEQPAVYGIFFDGKKQIPISFNRCKVSGNRLVSIPKNPTAASFLGDCTVRSGTVVTFIAKDGVTEITGNGKVGSGTTVRVSVSGQQFDYIIMIYGDISGDGEIGTEDLVQLRDILLEAQQPDAAAAEACDLYGEGGITLNSLAGLMSYLDESGTIARNEG